MKYLLIALLLISPLAFAEKWYEDGKPAKSKSFQGSSGDFGAMVLMTTDSQKVLENWSMPSPGVHILDAEQVEKGKPIEALVLFSVVLPTSKAIVLRKLIIKLLNLMAASMRSIKILSCGEINRQCLLAAWG